jgi:hypothetical protein
MLVLFHQIKVSYLCVVFWYSISFAKSDIFGVQSWLVHWAYLAVWGYRAHSLCKKAMELECKTTDQLFTPRVTTERLRRVLTRPNVERKQMAWAWYNLHKRAYPPQRTCVCYLGIYWHDLGRIFFVEDAVIQWLLSCEFLSPYPIQMLPYPSRLLTVSNVPTLGNLRLEGTRCPVVCGRSFLTPQT